MFFNNLNKKAQTGKIISDSVSFFAIILFIVIFLIIVLLFNLSDKKTIEYNLDKKEEISTSSINLKQILNSKIIIQDGEQIKEITFFRLLKLNIIYPENSYYSELLNKEIENLKEFYPKIKITKEQYFEEQYYNPENTIFIPGLNGFNKFVYKIII